MLTEQDRPEEPPRGNDDLNNALDALSERYRLLIHLYYYEGYRTEEIARILEMKASTVRSGLKRARKRLKDLMEGVTADV